MFNQLDEVEQVVLGHLTISEKLSQKVECLNEEDFSTEEHKTIFRAIKTVFEKYNCVDIPMLLAELKELDICRHLDVCATKAVAPSLFDDYVEALKRGAGRRRLRNAVSDLIFSDNCTLEELKRVVDEEEKQGSVLGVEKKSDANFDSYVQSIEKKKELIDTGLVLVDKQIKGLEKGTFLIIGARPSTGKTTFALNIADYQIKKGRKTVFFSLEMSAQMIYDRLVSNRLNLSYPDVLERCVKKEDREKIKSEILRIKESRLFSVVDDTYNVENICAQIAQLKPAVAVVDFIQVVSSLHNYRDLREKINYVSSELKRIAKKTGCVVIALSQVTRMGKDAPTMSDLRESGALEQDGDYIIMLHRPYVADKNFEDETQTSILFDKNKFGWTGSIKTYFDVLHQRFTGFCV